MRITTILKAPILIGILLFSIPNLFSQARCEVVEDQYNPCVRTSYTCNDLDELTADEVLAMPTLEIPVVFQFRAYTYTGTGGPFQVNFSCDINDPDVSVDWLLYAPTFATLVLNEMNDRMRDQLNEDPSGIPGSGTYSDARIHYYRLDEGDCHGLFFYGVNDAINYKSNAVNLLFDDNNATTNGGVTGNFSNTITLWNYARGIYQNHDHGTWGVGRLINHENCHRFCVNHTWNCTNPCRNNGLFPNNPLNPSDHCCGNCTAGDGQSSCAQNGCGTVFLMGGYQYLMMTLCEHRELWSHELQNPRANADYCNTNTGIDILTYDTHSKIYWKGQRLINSDVVIKNGTEIEIQCNVHMGANKKIIVERGARLTLNGGHIDGLCDYKWQGIVVEGFSNNSQLNTFDGTLDPNKAGTVVMKNSSSISDAKTAISMANSQYTWPAFANYYGGLVHCEHSSFTNCDRAVEFMKYGKETSRFENCTFNKMISAVTMWENSGVVFSDCDFYDIEKQGILTYDSWMFVEDGCTFKDMPTGIELYSTYTKLLGPIIGTANSVANEFTNTDYGIYATSPNDMRSLSVVKNIFIDDDDAEYSDIGIHIDGHSHFVITNNLFTSVFTSQELMATGSADNRVFKNESNGNTMATHYMYDNLGSRFINNCYSNSQFSDVELNNSYIFPLQGNGNLSASNCFTKSFIPSLACNSHMNNVIYYKYGTGCFNPIISSNCSNISVSNAFDFIPITCSTSLPPFTGDFPSDCTIPSTTSGILSAFNALDGTISSTQANSHYTSEEKYNMILGFRQCQSTLMSKFIELNLSESNLDTIMIDSLVKLLSNRTEFIYKINAYGLRVLSGNYAKARQYLNALTKSNQDETDFVKVQNINLNFLTNRRNYVASQNTLDTLSAIGVKIHPYAGYARSLYHELADERLELVKPTIIGVVIPRSETTNNILIKCYPNPVVNGKYIIDVTNNKNISNVFIEIFSSEGQAIYAKKESISENSNVIVDTKDWPSNMYFIAMKTENGNLIYSGKFTVFNK